MGLLDFLSPALTATTASVGAFDDARRERDETALERGIADQERQAERKRRDRMDALNQKNILSQIEERERTRFTPFTKTGQVLNTETGELSGDPAATPVKPLGEYEERPEQGGVAVYRGGQFDKWKIQPVQGGDRVAASTRTQLAENAASLDLIRQAREALQNRPESVGLKRGVGLIPGMGQIGEVVNQRQDPDGNAVRQLIGQVSAMKIKDLSGAAVTVSEFPRLAAFVPLIWDTPEKIQLNLNQLERELTIVMDALQNGVTLAALMGGATPTGSTPSTPQPAAGPVAPPVDFEAWKAARAGRTP